MPAVSPLVPSLPVLTHFTLRINLEGTLTSILVCLDGSSRAQRWLFAFIQLLSGETDSNPTQQTWHPCVQALRCPTLLEKDCPEVTLGEHILRALLLAQFSACLSCWAHGGWGAVVRWARRQEDSRNAIYKSNKPKCMRRVVGLLCVTHAC